ncbi:MAG: hypothetical protein ACR2JC_00415 [Chloroflexota bacterium]|nr:MAG: hypothetical protein DLM70_10030 [Chloroflexota bacterium]
MTIVGVRLSDGGALWADTNGHSVSLLDRVQIDTTRGVVEGVTFALPEQLLNPPREACGEVIAVFVRERRSVDCLSLPGADVVALGTYATNAAGSGRVVAIDAVRRLVTIRIAGGREMMVDADTVSEAPCPDDSGGIYG